MGCLNSKFLVKMGLNMGQGREVLRVRFVQDRDATKLVRNRFYTVGEVATMLRVHEATVWRWLQHGKLIAVTYGEGGPVRIRGTAIFKFLKPYAPQAKPKAKPKSNGGKRVVTRKPKPKAKPKEKPTRRSPEPRPEAKAPKPAQ